MGFLLLNIMNFLSVLSQIVKLHSAEERRGPNAVEGWCGHHVVRWTLVEFGSLYFGLGCLANMVSDMVMLDTLEPARDVLVSASQ